MAVKNEYTCTCIKCGKQYKIYCTEKQYKKGTYRKTCSSACANSRIMTDERCQKIKEGVKSYNEKNKVNKSQVEYQYICDKCGKNFVSKIKIRNDRYKHCEDCRQHRKHAINNPNSILDVSKRTITKILKRANKGCSICGWNESTCDIHHIIERKNGGTDNIDNLIIVCPNCHRIIHTTKKYSKQFLLSLSIDKTFVNWKDFYYISN